MADACCGQIIGSKVYISAGDARWEAMGDVTIEPTNVAREGGATASGRLTVVETAKPYRATMDLANFCNGDPRDLFNRRCKVDIQIIEEGRGFMHLFTASSIVGSPSLNIQSGVMSGVEIVTDDYVRVDRP